MYEPIRFENEPEADEIRCQMAASEPKGLRTRTPTMAVLTRSEGIYHWTADGRRLADFTSGVLVANLGHNPRPWLQRLAQYLGWDSAAAFEGKGFFPGTPLTAYNAISTLEAAATLRLLRSVRSSPGGERLQQVMWAASGSEAIQKALWAALHFQPDRDIILATRNGFHGKKGLAGAVTGDERSPDRDPRVRFIGFPMRECCDVSARNERFDETPYRCELDQLARQYEGRLNCLITEPYLGGGGSYHPPLAYLQLLQRFCREHGLLFILDEVQSNFGRTGRMYAFETYGLTPDIVVLGKGMGNGIPVNAAVGSVDVFDSLDFGEASDTWSAHPLGCAAVLATLDIFESTDLLEHTRAVAQSMETSLCRLKELEFIAAVRGEGMVWGVELADCGPTHRNDVALECVRAAYRGDGNGDAVHLLGPLGGNVIRISPPLVITHAEVQHWVDVLFRVFGKCACRE